MQTKIDNHDREVRRRPTQERSRKRFEAILAAATQLVAERGLATISMTDIAYQAGMGLTAVYRYFPTKEAIVRELTLSTFDADAQMTSAFAANLNASSAEQIALSLAEYCHHIRSDHFRLQIRAAVHADASLSMLDLEDSRSKAQQIAAAIDRPGLGIPRLVLERRVLLVIETLDGLIRLASRVDDTEAEAIINEFTQMASDMLLRDKSYAPT